ncbi:UDP-glucuronosyltransferase 1-6 [Ooceraea biroi]|uniref:UDP-glucuronosyltransferase 1-6 n=1 Tax=Ooceraea biroi TaxID=2015173 RepID=A0A026WL17_OOCBI|nr:UDP-glucuronosyltransferase 1-6 [Ooceraea biroi]
MFEQASRIQRLASLGAAIFLKLNELSKERLNTAIHQILNDKSYKERMAYLSELSKDQPYDSLENAIWWVEYVMRHKGISHLRFSESDKPWYQRYDMDIIGFLAVVAFVMSLISLYTLFRILRFCCGYYQLYKNIHYPNIKFKMQ